MTPVPKRHPGQPGRRSRRRTHPTADPARAWARRLNRTRPGLTEFVLDGLATTYGHPQWRRRNDPTSELVLTILAQNTADTNAEQAFESLRRRFPFGRSVEAADAPPPESPPNGWGGLGLRPGDPPDWPTVETAPIEELVDAIRPGGLANQKAPRIQAALRAIREERGNHSLEFLGSMPPPEALAWLRAETVRLREAIALFGGGHALAGATLQDGGLPAAGVAERLDPDDWARIEVTFFGSWRQEQ